jgi:hypothetical protein
MTPAAIARLFEREARQEAALRQTRAKLDAACAEYARQSGRAFMRRESVRAEIGAGQ